MGLGLGILLLLIGAVLTFTDLIEDAANMGNLDTLGWILMALGALSLIWGLLMTRARANTSHTEVIDRRGPGYNDRV